MFSYKTIALVIVLCTHQSFIFAGFIETKSFEPETEVVPKSEVVPAISLAEISSQKNLIEGQARDNSFKEDLKDSEKNGLALSKIDTTSPSETQGQDKSSEFETIPLDESKKNIVTSRDIETLKQFIKQMLNKKNLQENKLISKTMFQINDPTDINTSYALAKGFGEKNSRNVIQSMFNRLQSSKSQGLLSRSKLINSEDFPQKFAKDFIQKVIDGNLGIDANSFQSIYSLPNEIQKKLETHLTQGDYSKLFKPTSELTNVQQVQLLANMHDDVMNIISGSKKFDAEGNLTSEDITQPIFTTEYDDKGNYTSTMTASVEGGTSVQAISTFDYKGNPTSRTLKDEQGNSITTNLRSGWFYGNYESGTETAGQAATQKALNDIENAIFDNIWDLSKIAAYFKANVRLAYQDSLAAITKENAEKLAKTTIKVGLSAGKQTGIYLLSSLLPYHIPLASAALLLPFVKIITVLPAMHTVDEKGEPVVKTYTGYQFTGYKWSDPTMALVAMKAIHVAVGDNGQFLGGVLSGGKPLLSGQGKSVFRKGTWPSNAARFLQGKSLEAEQDLNETYIEAIPAVLQMVYGPLQLIFPQTLGSTILSKADLEKASKASNSVANNSN
ncbi:MAG: hypothetical protein JO129_03925 [Candidatus Dependentiae bacterium]|nr:hypothetical protein [Candidatus Dependentiae bacterium]